MRKKRREAGGYFNGLAVIVLKADEYEAFAMSCRLNPEAGMVLCPRVRTSVLCLRPLAAWR